MKRYALFAGSIYYPAGGWDDFKDTFDTVEAAKSAGEKSGEDWWHVIDLTTGEEIE